MKPPTAKQVTERFEVAWKAVRKMAGTELDECAVQAILSSVAGVCIGKRTKLTSEQCSAAYGSAVHLVGKVPDIELLKSNVYRLIANWYFIMEGMAIPEWDGSRETSDVLFMGILRRISEPGKKPEFEVKIKLKTGLCAGIISCTFLKESQIYGFLEHVAGVANYNCAAEEISGMQARVTVEYTGDVLRVRQWSCTNAQKEANKQLAEARTDVRKCRRNIPCNTCRCTIEQCPLAVWIKRKEQHEETEKERANNTSLHTGKS